MDRVIACGGITSPFFAYDNGHRAVWYCHFYRIHKNKNSGSVFISGKPGGNKRINHRTNERKTEILTIRCNNCKQTADFENIGPKQKDKKISLRQLSLHYFLVEILRRLMATVYLSPNKNWIRNKCQANMSENIVTNKNKTTKKSFEATRKVLSVP